MEPSKVYLLMTWEDPADGLTLFPLGVAYTEERARAVAEIHGRTKAIEEIETGTDEPPVLEWQEPNVDGHTHLMHEDSGLSLCYFQELVAFVDIEAGV
jgi:hypothetical protein